MEGTMNIKATCHKCGGRGRIQGFGHVAGGICFTCQGKGFIMVKRTVKEHAQIAVWGYLNGHIGANDAATELKALNATSVVGAIIRQAASQGGQYHDDLRKLIEAGRAL